MSDSPPRAWAEINLTALDHNLAFIEKHTDQPVMAILKAGAYGHGLVNLARHLDTKNPPYFGVANVLEARRLTQAHIRTPIYLLGATFPDEREEVVLNGWTPCLSSLPEIQAFQKLATRHQRTLTAHLALDTGMGRGGFLPDQLESALNLLSQSPAIQLTGIGSHLPSADEDPDFTRQQFNQFDSLVETALQTLSPSGPFHIHLANSAGLLDYQSRTTNLVRPGLMLYGISPIPFWQKHLQPVMTLKSRVALVRTLPAGHGISYGRTSILAKDTPVATIGLGYGDGLPRNLPAGNTHILINGQPAPLLGRVTMDQIMADVSSLPCQPGDEVEIFGPNLPVSRIAAQSGTIPWEILTRITSRVTRLYLP
ncbi:MAG: alanine racemase [Verrucomicrobiota bacterium]